ncbi:MAG: NTP transferase domain-containing protein [Acidimicrobiales bacterium]
MRSSRPKPIHRLCGRAMASYVLDTLAATGVREGVVVTGRDGSRVAKRLLEDTPGFPVRFVEQKFDAGTADAVLAGLSGFDEIDDEGDLLIVPADLPLLRSNLLERLVDVHRTSGAACSVLTVTAPARPNRLPGQFLDDATAGPEADVVRRDRHDRVEALEPPRPEAGLTSRAVPADRVPDIDREGAGTEAMEERSTGVFCVRRGLLAPALRRAAEDSVDGRGRLAEVVEVLAASGHSCVTMSVAPVADLVPVGDRRQLAETEAEMRRRTNRYWLSMGVTMVDPDRTYIDTTVALGTDVTLFPGTFLQGTTTIGDGCELGPDTRLDGCSIGANVIMEQTTARLAAVGDDCRVGPYAVLAPGTHLGAGTVTGAFYAGDGSAT